jgi:hypothetical protein
MRCAEFPALLVIVAPAFAGRDDLTAGGFGPLPKARFPLPVIRAERDADRRVRRIFAVQRRGLRAERHPAGDTLPQGSQ